MPTVAILPRAIRIHQHRVDHDPPHFHARKGGEEVVIRIADLGVHQGSLRRADLEVVIEWAARHQADLALNWILARAGLDPRDIEWP
jgi:Domain of unknown function (DUF4160)